MNQPINQETKRILIKRVFNQFIRKRMSQIILAVFFMIISAACTSVQPIIIQLAFDKILHQQIPLYIKYLPIAVVVIFMLSGISNYLSNILMSKAGYNVVRDMQKELFRHFLSMDVAFHLKKTSGELVSRITNDIGQIKAAVSNLLVGVFKQGLNIVGLVAVIFYQNAELAVIAFGIFIFVIYPISRISKRLYKLAKQEQGQVATLTHKLNESFHGIRTVKAYRREDFEIKRINSSIDNMIDLRIKAARVSGINSPVLTTLAGLSVALVLWYASNMIAEGRSTAGEIVAFIGALLMLSRPIKSMGGLSNVFFTAVASAQRYFQIYDMTNTVTEKPDAVDLKIGDASVDIKNLSFHYDEDMKHFALKDVTMHIPGGKKVALVGHSGSGKSTILNLLLRFFDPQEGAIEIDGQNIRDAKLSSLRNNISLVTQDIFLFEDTIAANIAYGKDNVTQECIEKAAKTAGAHEFIIALPHGYNTVTGENGVRLSGGQKQRISIARAILRNTPILLLDEATSALDNKSEREFQQALDEMMAGKTTIIVAHRLSTVLNSDLIYVMDGGQVKDVGTHQELLESSEIYKELYK